MKSAVVNTDAWLNLAAAADGEIHELTRLLEVEGMARPSSPGHATKPPTMNSGACSPPRPKPLSRLPSRPPWPGQRPGTARGPTGNPWQPPSGSGASARPCGVFPKEPWP